MISGKSTRYFKIAVLGLLAVVPLSLMFQGLDFTDTGWVLANNQQVFSDPGSASYWFHLWLSNVLGGVWNMLFGGGGLLSFRFAGVLIFWCTAFFVYRIYQDRVSTDSIFCGLLMGMVFHFPNKIAVIHYNNMTALLYVLGIFSLLSGLLGRSRPLILLSGFFLCLNVFVRLPNVLGILMVLVIPYSAVLDGRPRGDTAKDAGWFFLGFLAAGMAVLFTMILLGHFSFYQDAVRDLFSGSREDLSHYGANTMEKKFFVDHARAVFAAGTMLGGFFLLDLFTARGKNRFPRFFVLALMAAAVACGTWVYFWMEPMVLVYPMIGLCYMTFFAVMALPGKDCNTQKLAAFASALTLMVLSVGSDTGMKVGSFVLIIGLPLVLWYWGEVGDIRFTMKSRLDDSSAGLEFLFDRPLRRRILAGILVFFAAYSIPFVYRNTYRDSPDRLRMTVGIDHPLLRGVYTTPERASAVSGLLDALAPYAGPGDYLLTFESIPMVHFITRTRSYLYNPWSILYLPSEFETNLEKARRERPGLPPAVLAKVQTRSSSWPKSGPVSKTLTALADREILYRFLEENRYSPVWENEAFRILLPPR